MRVKLNGPVTDSGWAKMYRLFGFEVCCPKDVRDAVENCPEGEDLIFEINSGGGSVFAGFEMYSLIKGFAGKAIAEVQSLAASAASVIMAACDEVLMSPVAQVMIHRASAAAQGNSGVMRAAKQMLDSIDDSILNAYVDKVHGKTGRDELQRMMRNETFLTAERAIATGLADGILDGGSADPALAVASMDGPMGAASLPAVEDLIAIAKTLEGYGEKPCIPASWQELMDAVKQASTGGDRKEAGVSKDENRVALTDISEKAATVTIKLPESGEKAAKTAETLPESSGNAATVTAETLKEMYPDIMQAIRAEAFGQGVRHERTRIKEIEDVTIAGCENAAYRAKYIDCDMNAGVFAQQTLAAIKNGGKAPAQAAAQPTALADPAGSYLQAAMRDAQASGVQGVAAAVPGGTDEFLEAVRKVNARS